MALKRRVKNEQVLILPHLNTQEILHAEFEKLVMEFFWKNYSIGVTKRGLHYPGLLFNACSFIELICISL